MNSRFGPLGRLAKLMVLRLIRFYIREQEDRHSDLKRHVSELKSTLQEAEFRLAALEATQQRVARMPSQALTARELVRVVARLNALEGCSSIYVSKRELSSVRSEAARSLKALRLLHEEEIDDAGSYRSYMQRELQRNLRQTNLQRQRIEAAVEAILERLSVLEVASESAVFVAEMKTDLGYARCGESNGATSHERD